MTHTVYVQIKKVFLILVKFKSDPHISTPGRHQATESALEADLPVN